MPSTDTDLDTAAGRSDGQPARPKPSHAADLRPEVLAELLVAAGRGDSDAFSSVFRATYGAVRRAAAAVVQDEAQAEEVAQDVLLEAWLKAARFDPARGSAYTWIMTIARRRAVDCVRRAQQTRVRDSRYHDRCDREAAAQHGDVADDLVRRLTSVEVRSRLGDLTPLQREALTLAYFDGHSYAGVAELLEVPPPTAKTRIRDGLIRLRAALADQAPCVEPAR